MELRRNRNKTVTNEHRLRLQEGDLERWQRRNKEAATIRESNRTLQVVKRIKILP
jgi:hypothetical protein